MAKWRRAWCLALVVAFASLGLVSSVVAPVAAAPLGTTEGESSCPVGSDPGGKDDEYPDCVFIGQGLYVALKDGKLSGQVRPQSLWKGQDVCLPGTRATLQARIYADHDPNTDPLSVTESATSDANGYFAFAADLPFGTEYSVALTPRPVVGGDAYCLAASTQVFRHVADVGREVSASYTRSTGKVTGRVEVPGDQQVEDACSDLQTATLLQRFNDRSSVAVATATFRGADETFSIDVGDLAGGEQYYVEIAERDSEGFPDICRDARVDVTVLVDRDDDGVGDAADECDDVVGPVHADVPGCPVVGRQISASYDGQRVSGELTIVSFPPGVGNACESAMRVEVWALGSDGWRDTLVALGWTGGGPDQTYSFPVTPPLPSGTRFVAATESVLEPGIAVCGGAQSPAEASDDQDGDGVPDAVDGCPAVFSLLPTGCPTVTRSVTASYRAGELTGKVSVESLGGAPPGACSLPARLRVWQIGADGSRTILIPRVSSQPGGSFSIALALDPGTTVVVAAVVSGDPGVALCAAAESAPVTVLDDRDDDTVPDAADDCPDVPGPVSSSGCPVVERVVEASYAAGTVSGTARPLGSGVPVDACAGAPVAVTYVDAEGGQVRYDDLVGPDGAFELGVGRPPVGATLTVTLRDYDHAGVAICPAVQPSTVVIVASDRDDDGVPDGSDACPGVQGPPRATSSGCPVVRRRLVTSYVDGVLTGSVSLVDPQGSPPGACSARSFVEAVTVEGTQWKDSLWSGWTDAGGTFAAPIGRLTHETAYYVWADPYLDPDAGICETADQSAVFLDRDGDRVADGVDLCAGVAAPQGYRGCPKVEQSLTSKYDVSGTVTGRLRVMNPALAPGTCQSATVQLLRAGADGVATAVGSTATEPDGSYRIVLAKPLAGGDVYFALATSSVDHELAFCSGGQSASRVAPAPPATG